MLIPSLQPTSTANQPASSTRWEPLRHFLEKLNVLHVAGIAILLAGFYWTVLASDRYVSEAHVVIQLTNLSSGPTVDFSALLGNSANSRSDQMLFRDYLLSVDMLKKLDAELALSAHYSDSSHDFLSRMWLSKPSIEWFHRYFLSRVSVEFDDYAGVLIVKSQGYDKKMAQAIATIMLREGEHFMNMMARSLAQDQVTFLEKQVLLQGERAIKTRQAVLAYQNRKGLASPQSTGENLVAIISKLESQRTELQTQRNALQAYLVATHPDVVQLGQQIAAIERQIGIENNKLTSPTSKTLNSTIEEYQRLEMEAGFAQDIYKSSLVALEKGRIEATRNLKKVSIVQAPTAPEYSLEPRRLYSVVVFTLGAFLIAGILTLLIAVVRDHQD